MSRKSLIQSVGNEKPQYLRSIRTVPAGTPVELKGIEILHIDLSTRLIYNATSSADWIQLARQLGETVNI
jgi:hypothetical protein